LEILDRRRPQEFVARACLDIGGFSVLVDREAQSCFAFNASLASQGRVEGHRCGLEMRFRVGGEQADT
jgi:hypothetical protein